MRIAAIAIISPVTAIIKTFSTVPEFSARFITKGMDAGCSFAICLRQRNFEKLVNA